jgi:hypothetical protein
MQQQTPPAPATVPAQAPPQPPAPATALAQPSPPPASITTVGPDGKPLTLRIPRTEGEVRELLEQRQELSEQLTNVSSRRRNLAQEIRQTSDPPTRAGLEDRLRVLDQRILQLEIDLATTGRQISSAPAQLISATRSANQSGGGDDFEEAAFMMGGFFLLLLIPILFFARRRWKRPVAALPAGLGDESARRLERLEQGMEAIAIEIERVSEGQRFVTKLLSESQSRLGTPHRIGERAALEHEDPTKR